MPTPPKLTELQKKRLASLEPQLKEAAKFGDYQTAKQVMSDIQKILVPTGHTARLMTCKNWFFEAAMNNGYTDYAITGFKGVLDRTNQHTRVHLEATVLLAICHIRNGDLSTATPLIRSALLNDTVITSPERRKEFIKTVVERFEEESIISSLCNDQSNRLNIEEVDRDAISLTIKKSEDELLANLGEITPPEAVNFLREVHKISTRQLSYEERVMLPYPPDKEEARKLGNKVFSAFKKVLWRSLCDPNSDVYKLWYNKGLEALFNKKVLSTAIVTALCGMSFGYYTVAVSITALIFKMGIEVFCETSKPSPIMAAREKRKTKSSTVGSH